MISHDDAAETFVQLGFDGVVSCVSPGADALTGYAAEHMTGANLAAFVHPQDRDQLAESWRAVRNGSDQVTCTYRTCHKDTRQILTESTFQLVRDSVTGIPREMVGVMRDISSRAVPSLIEQSSSVAQLLVDSAVDYAIYLLDLDGTVKSWNAGAERIKGYTAQEIIGSNFSVFYTADDVCSGEPLRALEIARTTGKFEAEGWRVRKDRTRLWASVVIDVVRNPAGEVIGFAKITRDVTQSASLRNAAEENGSIARMLVDSVVDYAIYLLDLDGTVKSWNAGAERIKGYTAQEIIGSNFSVFYTADDVRAGEPARSLEIARSAGRFEATGPRVRKDGTHLLASVVIDAVRNPAGEVVGFAKVTRDVTQSSALRDVTKESGSIAQMLVDSVVDYAIYLLDLDGVVKSWNAGAQRIKGYSAEEIIGSNFSVFYAADDMRAGEPARALEAARTTGRFEAKGWRVRKDGTRLWASVAIDAIRNPAGEVVGFAKITRDVTEAAELRQGSEQLRLLSEQLLVAKNAVEEASARLLVSVERDRANTAKLNETNRLMAMAEQVAHVAHWRVDLRANELIWSDEIYRILGQPKSYRPELESALESYHPDDRLSVRSCVERALADGIPFSYEARIAHSDGSYRDITCSGQVEHADDGEITGLLGVLQDITDRKAAERERERLIMRFNLATQGARIGIWDWDIAANTFNCDPMQHTLFGFDAAQFFPDWETWTAAIQDDDRARVVHELTQALAGGAPYDTEFRAVWPNGEVHHIRAMATVVRGESGFPERMIGTNRDVTEVRTLTDELRQEQAWLLTERAALVEVSEQLRVTADRDRATAATLFEKNRLLAMAEQLAHTGHWRLDLITNELYWSDEMYRTFGLATTFRPTLPDAIAAYHPDDREEVNAAVQHAIAEGTPYTKESRVVRPDGTIRHVISTGHSERGADGTAIALFGVFHDVTENKDAEREHLRLLERVSVATQAAQVGIWEWDIATDAVLWDPMMFALYGLDDAAFVPAYDKWTASLHEADRSRVEQELAQAVSSGATWEAEFRVVWAKGEVHNIRAMATVVRDAAGSPKRVVGTNWDVTEVRTLTEELKEGATRLEALNAALQARTIEAEAATLSKSEFLANMSHEIRSPMNAILGMLQLLQTTGLSARQADYSAKACVATQALLRLLNDILDFSKIEAGKLAFENAPFEIDAMMWDVSSLLSASLGAKPVELLFAIDDQLPKRLQGDVFRLRQVLLNLAGNAIKFTAAGEIVIEIRQVALGPTRCEIEFSVRDTGIGIAPEQLTAIFEGFNQGEASTTRRYGGSGLGLAISQRIVSLMGGQLDVESEVGRGSRFHFTLSFDRAEDKPLTEMRAERNQAEVSPCRPAASGRLSGLKILVVDDFAINLQIADELLSIEGAQVEVAGGGRAAIDKVQRSQWPFDVVLMDVQMPEMDGYETTRRLREFPQMSGVAIIAVTANAMESDKATCLAAGMNDHLPKPIDIDVVVRTILGRPRPAGAARVNPVAEITTLTSEVEALQLPRGSMAENGEAAAGKPLILVVDDEPSYVLALFAILQLDYEVCMATTGEGALAFCSKRTPDLILLDVNMPDMDGLEVCRRIKSQESTRNVPIIFVTANNSPVEEEQAFDGGAADFIPKPFHENVVKARVRAQITLKMQSDALRSLAVEIAEARDEALHAASAKAAFLAAMSHEIRTPMSGVVGMSELLLLTTLTDEQRSYATVAHDSGQSLLRVINDILDFSKIEAGKLDLEAVAFGPASQVESVVALLRNGAEGKGVTLCSQVAENVPDVVMGDPGRVRQILLNFVGNALKFTPAGGVVRVDVIAESRVDERVGIRYTVRDTGIGIAPDVQARLFEPFAQANAGIARKFGGTGLGLSICKQLVVLMGGTIGVESVAGEGASFWFLIPFVPSDAALHIRDATPRDDGDRRTTVRARTERILLVEDDDVTVMLAKLQFKRLGFEVMTACNGLDACRAVQAADYDLIFMDCQMPKMDGFEATKQIRKLEAGTARRVPIVAMTADAHDTARDACLAAGMNDYVSKPTTLASLGTIFERWLPLTVV